VARPDRNQDRQVPVKQALPPAVGQISGKIERIWAKSPDSTFSGVRFSARSEHPLIAPNLG